MAKVRLERVPKWLKVRKIGAGRVKMRRPGARGNCVRRCPADTGVRPFNSKKLSNLLSSNCWARRASLRSLGLPVHFRGAVIRRVLSVRTRAPEKRPRPELSSRCPVPDVGRRTLDARASRGVCANSHILAGHALISFAGPAIRSLSTIPFSKTVQSRRTGDVTMA